MRLILQKGEVAFADVFMWGDITTRHMFNVVELTHCK